jgi:hypothetical protein
MWKGLQALVMGINIPIRDVVEYADEEGPSCPVDRGLKHFCK